MTPWYRKHGKILKIVTDEAFADGMDNGHFTNRDHKAYPVLLHYSAVRKSEALRTVTDQLVAESPTLYFDVGPRLKKIRRKKRGHVLSEERYQEILKKRKAAITTPPVPLPIDAPYMDELLRIIDRAQDRDDKRLFPFSPKTAWNIIDRAFGAYSHLFRLSRITWFFLPHPEVGRPRGFSIPEVKNWTGLSLAALDYYIGLADMSDMGRAMYMKQRQGGDQDGNAV